MEQALKLIAAGDAFITRRLSAGRDPRLAGLVELIRGADAAFVNLEILFHRYEMPPAAESGGTWAAADPVMAAELRWAGFNLFACANNHATDYGIEGMFSTMRVLDDLGAVHAGTGRTLTEARRPAYLETAAGRVALISASSTFTPFGRAGDAGPDLLGRPGLNPLRFRTRYEVDAAAMESLRRISDDLGLTRREAERRMWDLPENAEDGLRFLENRFVEAEGFAIRTEPHPGDLAAHQRWIAEARRQADWVLVSLHTHEWGATKEEPAEFVHTFARACVEAGADAFLAHGPHIPRGIEVYRGRPILYGLGNFVFQNDTVERQPPDAFERYGLGPDATPADLFDRRGRNDTMGFPADRKYWESVVAELELRHGGESTLRLHPITLGFGLPRSARGAPRLATHENGERILAHIADLCAPYGLALAVENGTGVARFASA